MLNFLQETSRLRKRSLVPITPECTMFTTDFRVPITFQADLLPVDEVQQRHMEDYKFVTLQCFVFLLHF